MPIEVTSLFLIPFYAFLSDAREYVGYVEIEEDSGLQGDNETTDRHEPFDEVLNEVKHVIKLVLDIFAVNDLFVLRA